MDKQKNMLIDILKGKDHSELHYTQNKRLRVNAFQKKIASFLLADDTSLSTRVINKGRSGLAYTEKISKDSIKKVLKDAEENCLFSEPDIGNVLYNKNEQIDFDGQISTFNQISTEAKKELVLRMEAAAYATDSRIVNVKYSEYGEITGSLIIANSYGLLKSRTYGKCSAYVYLMAKEGDSNEIGSDIIVAKSFDKIDPEQIGKNIAKKATEMLGAQSISSGTYSIIFDEQTASELLGAFICSPGSPFYGENIQKGRSKLAEKLNQKIGSKEFTLIDDPNAGLTPINFDDEGVPTSKLSFVEKGVFLSIIHNQYSSIRGKTESTGHGRRERSGVVTSLNNPYLQNGLLTQNDLLKSIDSGLLITVAEGFHAGLNPISGDFSISAKGFMVKNGIKSYPVKNIVIAGNFYEMIHRLKAKGNDRRVETFANFSSPSILIEELSVSGG